MNDSRSTNPSCGPYGRIRSPHSPLRGDFGQDASSLPRQAQAAATYRAALDFLTWLAGNPGNTDSSSDASLPETVGNHHPSREDGHERD